MNTHDDDDDDAHTDLARAVGGLMPAMLIEVIDRVDACAPCASIEALAHILGVFAYASKIEMISEDMEEAIVAMLKRAAEVRAGLVESNGETTLAIPKGLLSRLETSPKDVSDIMDSIFSRLDLREG